MNQLIARSVIHYGCDGKKFSGIDIFSLQETIGKSINVLDVVVLAYECLSGIYQGRTFVDEFAKLYYTRCPINGPSSNQYTAASCVYFGVKQHVKDALGIPLEKIFPKFRIVQYAFGQNKQTLAVVIESVRLPAQCNCYAGGNRAL